MTGSRPFITLLSALLLSAHSLAAQGFAGLGVRAENFQEALPGKEFSFPEDHGAHPAFRIEWWYLTANLRDAQGNEYGLQWTLFRSAAEPYREEGWASPQVWMGHAAVTTPERHFVAERLARDGIGQAGVVADPFDAWIDDWQMAGPSFDTMRLTASGTDFAYDMQLTARGPLVFHGDAGYSLKSASGRASYYYSQPFFEIRGTLELPQGPVEVTGNAWLDREWASQLLEETQVSWDWFSMSFDTGGRLMGFTLRDSGGGTYTAATWIALDGTPTPYPDGAFIAEPLRRARVAGREVPVDWRVRLPDRELDVTVRAMNDHAWMDTSVPYWEGPVRIDGSHTGRGYLEMTGY